MSCLVSGGLLCMKAALASVLLVPCGLRRQNIQVDLGALRGLYSYWKKPGQLAQGDPATYSIQYISGWSLNEGPCCLELVGAWGLLSAWTCVRQRRNISSIPRYYSFCLKWKPLPLWEDMVLISLSPPQQWRYCFTWMWVWFWTQPVPAVQCPVG